MYKITQADQPDDYAVNAVFIRLADNGCYVPCDRETADGVCVKQLREHTFTEEDGTETTGSFYDDTVYRFADGLKGIEPVGEVQEKDDAELFRAFREDETNRPKLVTAIGVLGQKRLEERYPAWEAGVSYADGTLLMHNGVLYETLQTHTSQADWPPRDAPSLFAVLFAVVLSSNTTGVIAEWVQPESTNPYMIGDKVTHNGSTWVSTVDDNVWEPVCMDGR